MTSVMGGFQIKFWGFEEFLNLNSFNKINSQDSSAQAGQDVSVHCQADG